jgi:hypothetical protein
MSMSAADIPDYFVGLDLGQPHEYTALALVERRYSDDLATYAVRHLHRWPLGTPYRQIADAVDGVLETPELEGCTLTVDQTGVGRAVVELFRRDEGFRRVAVTAGLAMGRGDDGATHVPKKELVATLQVLLQSRRLQVAARLPLAETLTREMATFRGKLAAVNGDDQADWREREHDDLVLAVALAAWEGERCPPPYRGLLPILAGGGPAWAGSRW